MPFLPPNQQRQSTGLFTDTSEHIRLCLVFLFSTVFHFLVVGSVLTRVGF